MKKKWLSEIQKRLPDDIIVVDETKSECTPDEYVAILCWLKYFNLHYKKYGKEKEIEIQQGFASRRIFLEFFYFNKKSDIEPKGKYIIYIKQRKRNIYGAINYFNL